MPPVTDKSGNFPSRMEAKKIPNTGSSNESFFLLANGAKGAAAINLLKQVFEASGVFVFGELIDHPNIQALQDHSPEGSKYLKLLDIFAYGTYMQYMTQKDQLPPLTPPMIKKLRLLTIASLATKSHLLKYSVLQNELEIGTVTELESLIIEGSSSNVVQGKLDQKSLHFEVDYAMARDLKKSDVREIITTLEDWCSGCKDMLKSLEAQAERANMIKQMNTERKNEIEKKIEHIRSQIKTSQQSDGTEDPDSRMDLDRMSDRREKKPTKGKGLRGTSKGFWPK